MTRQHTQACEPPPGAVLCMIPGPSVVIAEHDAGERWCFKCRKRLPHTDVLLDDPPERQPSYYEPVWSCRCSGCGEDHTLFPGMGYL
jgi:hypothetical protein